MTVNPIQDQEVPEVETRTVETPEVEEEIPNESEEDQTGTEQSSLAPEGDDNVYYSVVGEEAFEGDLSMNSLKDIMKGCIESFQQITAFISQMMGASKSTTNEIEVLQGEIQSLDTFDGTGSGKNSAYSLALPGTEVGSGTGEGASEEETEQNSEINEKITRLDDLSGEASDGISLINKASADIETTDKSVDKVLEKTKTETKEQNTITQILLGTVAVGGTALIGGVAAYSIAAIMAGPVVFSFPLAGVAVLGGLLVAGACIGLFGGGADPDAEIKAEINSMGEVAKDGSQEAKETVEKAKEFFGESDRTIEETQDIADTKKEEIEQPEEEIV